MVGVVFCDCLALLTSIDCMAVRPGTAATLCMVSRPAVKESYMAELAYETLSLVVSVVEGGWTTTPALNFFFSLRLG